jgi:hypothetical protein
MKKILHFLLIVAVLGALSWALWKGLQHPHETETEAKPEEHPPGEAKEEEPAHEDFTVTLEKEKWKALEFEMTEPEKAELPPRRMAFGRVLDPTPLVTLDSDLAAADATLAASRAEYERTQKLLASGENTSRKVAETAEAQFRTDEIKAAGLRRAASLQWGAAFSSLETTQRHALAEALVRGESALVRVDVLPGDALTDPPTTARLLVLGREAQPVDTSLISPAAEADPRTQAQGFILRVDKPPFALRPGMALTAWLELPEKPRAGFAIQRSALLRHDGRTWVFVQEEEEKFVRKPVTLDTPLDGDKGWFIAADGGLKAEDLVVTVGGQVLLSEEMKAMSGAAEEE